MKFPMYESGQKRTTKDISDVRDSLLARNLFSRHNGDTIHSKIASELEWTHIRILINDSYIKRVSHGIIMDVGM